MQIMHCLIEQNIKQSFKLTMGFAQTCCINYHSQLDYNCMWLIGGDEVENRHLLH